MKKRTELGIGRLEFVFEEGFGRDWANVMASLIYQEVKSELVKEGEKVCEEDHHLLKKVFRL